MDIKERLYENFNTLVKVKGAVPELALCVAEVSPIFAANVLVQFPAG